MSWRPYDMNDEKTWPKEHALCLFHQPDSIVAVKVGTFHPRSGAWGNAHFYVSAVDGRNDQSFSGKQKRITHWMPVPEVPQ